jgi:hypothetical protein
MSKSTNQVKRISTRCKIVIRNKSNPTHHQLSKLIKYQSNYITNDVTDNDDNKSPEIPYNIGVNAEKGSGKTDDIYTQFATLFFKNQNTISVPTKVKTLIERDLPKNILDKIHGQDKTVANRKVAVELCLLFLSQLSSTHRNIKNGSSPNGWKSLRAAYLRQLLRINAKTYQYVKDALLYEYEKGSILECWNYVVDKHSTKYRLGAAYRSKGFVPYKLQSVKVQGLFKKSCQRKLVVANGNTICINLLEFYKSIVLPTEDEILIEAKRLVKIGLPNKKGKMLIFNNKKGKAYYQNPDKLVFVEDSLKVFEYLTKNGLLIPRPGNEKSGGRIVDSLTLMPGWIRKLIKINGLSVAEADYSCLHPNIAMSLYGGSTRNLKHTDLCKETEDEKIKEELALVKKEHLSFFNKTVWQMKQSPLFDYYHKQESSMLHAIIEEKNSSAFEHKITSRRLFAKEVQMMTEVVSRLNEEGIFVGYIYDALFFDPAFSQKVIEVMNEVAVDLSVFTTADLV